MKLWKCDTSNWTVRQVNGEPWPGSDSEGNICYRNTHFADEADAWDSLLREAEAWVQLAASRVIRAREQLRCAEGEAADAVVAMRGAWKAREDREDANDLAHSRTAGASSGAPCSAGDAEEKSDV